MRGLLALIIAANALFFSSGDSAKAGEDHPSSPAPGDALPDYPFTNGTKEVQLLAGPFVSFTRDAHQRPAVNDLSGKVRFGWMLSTPAPGSNDWRRGNTELLVEVFGGSVYQGPGDKLVGGSLILRYNFVKPDTRLHPYVQVGAGGLYNDVYRTASQRLIGQAFEFNLQSDVGLKYLLNRTWALSLEAGYRHVSNAGLASRNAGLNSIGALAGVSFHF